MSSLFDSEPLAGDRGHASRPLAERLRPRTLAEILGQDHLLGPDGPLGRPQPNFLQNSPAALWRLLSLSVCCLLTFSV